MTADEQGTQALELVAFRRRFPRLRSGQAGLAARRQSWRYTTQVRVTRQAKMHSSAQIVVHYHELWLKLGNRLFFLHQLRRAMMSALEGISVLRITQPGDRYLVELENAADTETAVRRLQLVFGISHFAVARRVDWNRREPAAVLPKLCETAW